MPLARDVIEMAGTPCYMAPEMLGPDRGLPLTEQTDVYLAGAVLFELMTFRPPHDGSTAHEVVTSVVTSRPELPPGVPPELGRICLRAMEADPAARYPSIEAMQAALAAYVEHRGSARLAAIASERLDELLAVLSGCERAPDRAREEVFRLFGACRFGFHEALVAWAENTAASEGMRRAIVAVAEYELAGDDPRAALTLLGELDDPPAELVARAKAAAAQRALRQDELERLQREHDHRIGTRTRMFVSTLLGTLFTVVPLIGAIRPGALAAGGPGELVLWSLALLAVLCGLGFWARESMRKTLVNRRVFATGVLLFVGQCLLAVGAWELGASVVQIEVLWVFGWFLTSSMVALTIDGGMAPTAVGYAVAFLLAARWPEHRFWVMAGGNLVFTLNAAWRWRPATLRWTEEERAAREATAAEAAATAAEKNTFRSS